MFIDCCCPCPDPKSCTFWYICVWKLVGLVSRLLPLAVLCTAGNPPKLVFAIEGLEGVLYAINESSTLNFNIYKPLATCGFSGGQSRWRGRCIQTVILEGRLNEVELSLIAAWNLGGLRKRCDGT